MVEYNEFRKGQKVYWGKYPNIGFGFVEYTLSAGANVDKTSMTNPNTQIPYNIMSGEKIVKIKNYNAGFTNTSFVAYRKLRTTKSNLKLSRNKLVKVKKPIRVKRSKSGTRPHRRRKPRKKRR